MASSKKNTKGIINWIDYRLPVISFLKHSAVDYPTPRNLNYWWNFGSLAGFFLLVQNHYRSNIIYALHCACRSCF